jgi:hypothetical protein
MQIGQNQLIDCFYWGILKFLDLFHTSLDKRYVNYAWLDHGNDIAMQQKCED